MCLAVHAVIPSRKLENAHFHVRYRSVYESIQFIHSFALHICGGLNGIHSGSVCRFCSSVCFVCSLPNSIKFCAQLFERCNEAVGVNTGNSCRLS